MFRTKRLKNESFINKAGFTLVELLVVTAVIGILGVISATMISSILRSQNKTAIINEVRQNGNLVIDKFDRDVKQASKVCLLDSSHKVACALTAGVTGVSLTTTDGGTIVWDCLTSTSSFSRGEGANYLDAVAHEADVTNSDAVNGVAVAGCGFTVPVSAGSGIPKIVTLNFHITQGTGAPSKAEFRIDEQFEVTVGTRAYY